MSKCYKLPVLCVLLLAVGYIFCIDFSTNKEVAFTRSKPKGYAEFSNSDFFKSGWQNSKQRRSVKSVNERTDGQLKRTDSAQTTKTKPQFECGDRVLTLILNHADVTQMRIYGPLGDLLHLGQLAAFCGVSVKTTHTDVRLLFSSESCYIKQEAAEYVLSLSWYGTDMTLSCPLSVTPPSVICKKNALELTVAGEGTADELSVALNGEWAPLLYVATQCWHREPSSQGELTFLVPYTSCGVNFRDGRYNLDVRSKDKMMPQFCPYEPTPVFPVKDSILSAKPQPSVYYKPPTVFPSAMASQIVKQEQRFEPHDRSAGKPSNPPSLQPRSPWMPKIPTLPSLLPGAFNLAVNFPFSLPVPTRQAPEHLEDSFTSKPVFSTPVPTSTPTVSSSQQEQEEQELAPNVQPRPVYPEPFQQKLNAPVTKAPNLQLYPYMQYPDKFPKPASAPSHTDPFVQEYQHMSSLVPGTAQYLPFESAQNINFLGPHQHQVNDALSKLAHYLPPGYFICSCNNRQPQGLPQKFQQPILQPTQPDTSPTASAYLMPVKLQSQTRPYPPYTAARPLQPQYNQRPSGLVQQPGSTTHLPVQVSSQESRPVMLSSSHAPQYVQYQAGGDQYLDLSQRFSEYTAGTEISSHSPYQHSQQSKFPYPQLRPEVISADVSPGNIGSTPLKGFFQPRSLASASLQVPDLPGNGPFESTPPTPKSPPLPQFFPVKGHAQVAQPPYSQGPSFRYVQNPFAHIERPSEPRSPRAQNDTLAHWYQSSRQGSLVKDVSMSPHLKPTSQEEVQQPRKRLLSGSYFYRPPAADTRK